MALKASLNQAAGKVIGGFFPVFWKRFNEIYYWRARKRDEKVLVNDHYQHFYTHHFGLEPDFYDGKVVVDIGCGPRGSLEWARGASRRYGVDPLADEYLALGADQHAMEYLASPSESIPLEDASCDIVTSFNSLDHVDDLDATISEIKRICRPGGVFLLLVEINHEPTVCEPHKLTPRIAELFAPEFTCENPRIHAPVASGAYDSIEMNQQLPLDTAEIGYYSARLTRR